MKKKINNIINKYFLAFQKKKFLSLKAYLKKKLICKIGIIVFQAGQRL